MVLLVEVTLPKGKWSSKELEREFAAALPGREPVVWGCIEGVDAAWRKLSQLARETEQNRPYADREHSAWKAQSFFQDMFPAAFWKWKRIGGEHPTPEERPMMAGR